MHRYPEPEVTLEIKVQMKGQSCIRLVKLCYNVTGGDTSNLAAKNYFVDMES